MSTHAPCLAPDSPRFLDFFPAGAALTKLASGFIWAEGPVWVARGEYLLFSDVPANVVHRWSRRDGARPGQNASRAVSTNRRPRAS